MALSLHKVVNELVKLLKKEKPSGSEETYWRMLSLQLLQERSWEEELLNGIKSEIGKWLKSQNDKAIKELWERSESAIEEYTDESDPEIDTIIIDLQDEILDLILERVEDDNPKEEYFSNNGDDFELDDDYTDTDFLNEDFDDDYDDDYLDDDRY